MDEGDSLFVQLIKQETFSIYSFSLSKFNEEEEEEENSSQEGQ